MVRREWVIYHNPRCSKSRKGLWLLEQNDITPHVVEYLETPLGAEELRELIKKLGVEADAVVRHQEPEYTDAGLSRESSADEIIAALARYPKLLQRPIVVRGKRARIGRPPERILELL